MINIGIIGSGNVGTGVIDILQKNGDYFFQKTGKRINIKKVAVKNIDKKRSYELEAINFTTDPMEIINDPEIQVVIEVIGGENPAYEYICQALKNKKHVVTANKEVVAKHKTTFFKLANENGVRIRFEASVGGGIPLIHALKIGYAANKIQSVHGILNGTTNFILTKIEEEQRDFNDVLQDAQRLGFAEADPTMDISGLDVAYKLNILAAVAFNIDVNLSDIYYEGIENISLTDITYAKEFNYKIKLVAIGTRSAEDKLSFKVHPLMIPSTHPLAVVRNEFNALFINGDAVGESMLYGKGAGALPTGSAVISDMVDLISCVEQNLAEEKVLLNSSQNGLIPFEETSSEYYLRLLVEDSYGVLEKIAGVLRKNEISISKLIQKNQSNSEAELVIVTHTAKEKNMAAAIKEFDSLQVIKDLYSLIRVAGEAPQ
jgi:homoserine dehydrogenase